MYSSSWLILSRFFGLDFSRPLHFLKTGGTQIPQEGTTTLAIIMTLIRHSVAELGSVNVAEALSLREIGPSSPLQEGLNRR